MNKKKDLKSTNIIMAVINQIILLQDVDNKLFEIIKPSRAIFGLSQD